MSFDFRIPNITETSTEGQIAQIRSSLIQLTEQLNWALNCVNDKVDGNAGQQDSNSVITSSASSIAAQESEAQNTFSEIKSLIIKSADIVNAYYKEFGILLETEGKYMAVSDFGTYYEESSKTLVDKYDSLEEQYTNLQKVVDDMDNLIGEISTSALIKSGLLKYVTIGEYEGVPLYGIQVQQTSVDDVTGETITHKIAQLSAEGLEIFGNADSDAPTAIFKYNTMYVTNAEVSGELKLGGYRIKTSNGLSFNWEGR